MNYELVDTIWYSGEDGSASIKVIVDSTNITCDYTAINCRSIWKKYRNYE